MYTVIILVFVAGYLCIALEHVIKINKTASALVVGIVCWTLFMFDSTSRDNLLHSQDYDTFIQIKKTEIGQHETANLSSASLHREYVLWSLENHFGEIAQILFFLLGAMTIVELVDANHGFRIITDRINTKNIVSLLWIISLITFFLSAVLDNLTTTIVMVSVVRKLVSDRNTRLLFASMIIIAANAGGAWTPIGDITTTMLWIRGHITTINIMKMLFVPSMLCTIVPLIIISLSLKKHPGIISAPISVQTPVKKSAKMMLLFGIGALISVPVFKTLTHMPPYFGMLLGLGILWVISEFLNPDMEETEKRHYTVAGALSRIDVPSVLFFLGILLAVSALESMQVLHEFSRLLDETFKDQRIIITLIGLLSAVVDNVPLVAAIMGMYDLSHFPVDHMIWEYLAYCAGTGGSILVIGSAAGVAAMGIEKIDFIWYLKKISLLALAGYLAGALVYLILL